MFNTSKYGRDKKILAIQLANIFKSDPNIFADIVNNQLNNWERRNIILMINFYRKPVTVENLFDALTA